MGPLTPRRRVRESPPRFSPAEPSPPLSEALLLRLAQIPHRPTPLRLIQHWPFAFQELADYLTQAPSWLARMRGRLVRYPQPFRKVPFRSWDGTPLTAWLGVHQAPDKAGRMRPVAREGLLLVPGMFASKDNAVFRTRAVRIFQEWGYHVLSLDLRGMGESSRAFNTAGWKESEDVEAAVDYFRAHAPLDKVHVYSESLGAVAAILAAARQADRGFRLVDGALLAISPYPNARRLLRHLNQEPSKGDQFAIVQWFFAGLLRLGGKSYPDFPSYLQGAAHAYGISLAELYKRSSIEDRLAHVNIPLLLILSEDDPLVPRRELRAFERALRGHANPALFRLPWGSHCLFELLDAEWFWSVLREFFDFYCVLPKAAAPGSRRGASRAR